MSQVIKKVIWMRRKVVMMRDFMVVLNWRNSVSLDFIPMCVGFKGEFG